MSKFEDFGIGDGDVNKIEKNPDQLLSAEEDAIVLNEPDNSFKMLGKKANIIQNLNITLILNRSR